MTNIDYAGNILQLIIHPFDAPWGVINANAHEPLGDHLTKITAFKQALQSVIQEFPRESAWYNKIALYLIEIMITGMTQKLAQKHSKHNAFQDLSTRFKLFMFFLVSFGYLQDWGILVNVSIGSTRKS